MKRKSTSHHHGTNHHSHYMRHVKRVKENQSFVWAVLAVLLLTVLIRFYLPTSAASIGSPYWKEMTPISGYAPVTTCTGGEGGECTSPCVATTWNAFSPEIYTQVSHQDQVLYSDPTCSTVLDFGRFNKTVVCNPGEVMVGVRDYQHAYQVDEEHVDAYCAPVTGATVGAATFYSAGNATTELYGGYKEVTCPAGQVMSAVNMWGQYGYVDDEHVDAGCSSFSGTLTGTAQWVSAPNAFTRLEGGYKQAVCPSGQVMTGVRWYEYSSEVDDEHTDALCVSITPPPVVNVYFSMNN